MTETPPGTGSTDGRDGDWHRQTSTVDWEGWIAEANEADAKRAAAEAQRAADQTAAAAAPPDQFAAQPYSGQQTSYGQPAAQQYPSQQCPAQQYSGQQPSYGQPPALQFPPGQPNYPPPTGYPAPSRLLPTGYPQAGAPFQPFPVPTAPSRDVFAILALIFGILPTIPLGLIFGITGIFRTGHPARRGRGMAVTGLVLSLLWLAVTVALPALVKNGDTRSAASGGAVTKPATISPMELRVGDCYNDTVLTNRQGPASTKVGAIEVIPCSQPHNAVVYANTTLPAGAWTSATDKLAIANRQCRPLAMKYFNGVVLNPNLLLGAITPEQTQWEIGFHNALCLVVDPDKSFAGDIRQDR